MRPRLARTLAVLALLFLVAGLVSIPGARTDGRTTAADIASRATVRPSLSGTSSAAAKSAESPLLRRMTHVVAVVPTEAPTSRHKPTTSASADVTRQLSSATPKLASSTTTQPAPSAPVTDANSTNTPDWNCIAAHESGGSYTIGGAEPYGGKYQFSLETWRALGFPGVPNTSPPWMQDQAALKLWAWDLRYTGNPWSAWETAPMCGL